MSKDNTSEKILRAAEDEFLEKGFNGARMMSIAERAGVSHSMLHYYFRSKDDLFNMVFNERAEMASNILEGIDVTGGDIFESMGQFVGKQFDLIRENHRFGEFLIRDVLPNPDNLRKVIELARNKFEDKILYIAGLYEEARKAQLIKNVEFLDLVLNITALNMTSFFAECVFSTATPDFDVESFLDTRRQSNIDFIINALKPA